MIKTSMLSKTFDRFLSKGIKDRSEWVILWIRDFNDSDQGFYFR